MYTVSYFSIFLFKFLRSSFSDYKIGIFLLKNIITLLDNIYDFNMAVFLQY